MTIRIVAEMSEKSTLWFSYIEGTETGAKFGLGTNDSPIEAVRDIVDCLAPIIDLAATSDEPHPQIIMMQRVRDRLLPSLPAAA